MKFSWLVLRKNLESFKFGEMFVLLKKYLHYMQWRRTDLEKNRSYSHTPYKIIYNSKIVLLQCIQYKTKT